MQDCNKNSQGSMHVCTILLPAFHMIGNDGALQVAACLNKPDLLAYLNDCIDMLLLEVTVQCGKVDRKKLRTDLSK